MATRERSRKDREWTPWSLWTHGVSFSFVDIFLRDRYTCKLKYRDGWESTAWQERAQIGTAVHEVLERCYIGSESSPSRGRVRRYIREYVAKLPRVDQKGHGDLAMAAMLCEEYFSFWGKDFGGERQWLATEQKLELPYVYEDGKVATLTGYLDMLVREQGRLSVFDTKTWGEINEDDVVAEFPMNYQFNFYLKAVAHLFGEMPARAVLNLIRRPKHKQKKSQSIKEFVEVVRADVRKRPDHFFKRVPYPITKSDLKEWEDRQLHPIMADIRAWQEADFPAYPNYHGLYVKRAKSDMYRAILDGDFTGLINRRTECSSSPSRKANRSTSLVAAFRSKFGSRKSGRARPA